MLAILGKGPVGIRMVADDNIPNNEKEMISFAWSRMPLISLYLLANGGMKISEFVPEDYPDNWLGSFIDTCLQNQSDIQLKYIWEVIDLIFNFDFDLENANQGRILVDTRNNNHLKRLFEAFRLAHEASGNEGAFTRSFETEYFVNNLRSLFDLSVSKSPKAKDAEFVLQVIIEALGPGVLTKKFVSEKFVLTREGERLLTLRGLDGYSQIPYSSDPLGEFIAGLFNYTDIRLD